MTTDPAKDPDGDLESLLLRLAALISDGADVDWDAVESAAATAAEREMIRRLRALAEIRAVHGPRVPARNEPPGPSSPPRVCGGDDGRPEMISAGTPP